VVELLVTIGADTQPSAWRISLPNSAVPSSAWQQAGFASADAYIWRRTSAEGAIPRHRCCETARIGMASFRRLILRFDDYYRLAEFAEFDPTIWIRSDRF